MKYLKNGEMDDAAVVNALKRCVKQYQDGELWEVRDELVDIIQAIDEFAGESPFRI